jgi:hypothetical protein
MGEPRINGVDGHFLHGKWYFGTARSTAKACHIAARRAASVAHMRREDLGVFTHVARLRCVLEPRRGVGRRRQVVVTAGDGWVLRVAAADIDACRFEALVAGARAALVSGRVADAAEALTDALALWHGPP